MATPIEIAGLTLAVFPIVINGLTQMREGAETVRYWRRYRVKLKEYACELDSARVYYLDTLEELLVGIVDSKDEMSKLMEDPGGAAWRQPKYDARLRQRLDRSYGSYMQILEKMRDASLDLRSKLGLDASGKVSKRLRHLCPLRRLRRKSRKTANVSCKARFESLSI